MDRDLQPISGFIYKIFQMVILSDIEPNKRPKPKIIENIPQLKRKEQSIYKPTDLWTAEDDLLFFKILSFKENTNAFMSWHVIPDAGHMNY